MVLSATGPMPLLLHDVVAAAVMRSSGKASTGNSRYPNSRLLPVKSDFIIKQFIISLNWTRSRIPFYAHSTHTDRS